MRTKTAAEAAQISKGFPMDKLDFFKPLYVQTAPVGYLGRGTHHSVYRSISWYGLKLQKLARPLFHDFAIIWDEDHDTRVFEAIQKLYIEGLLAAAIFVGERKGTFHFLIDPSNNFDQKEMDEIKQRVDAITQDGSDPWPAHVDFYNSNSPSIINDASSSVQIFLESTKLQWSLGFSEVRFPNNAQSENILPA
jgi:hypothetical protein